MKEVLISDETKVVNSKITAKYRNNKSRRIKKSLCASRRRRRDNNEQAMYPPRLNDSINSSHSSDLNSTSSLSGIESEERDESSHISMKQIESSLESIKHSTLNCKDSSSSDVSLNFPDNSESDTSLVFDNITASEKHQEQEPPSDTNAEHRKIESNKNLKED